MKQKLLHAFLLLITFLASCAPARTTTSSPPSTVTVIPTSLPTSTYLPPTLTITPPPTITQTSTPIPCDPSTADFCISDGHFSLQRPIHPPANDLVERTYPFASTANGTRDPHHGVEFENEFGTPVHAAADGLVVFAGSDDAAIFSPWRNYYGNLVALEHENHLSTLYAHLSRIDVELGKAVSAGDKIGEVGQSGVAIGSHLHFEVRQGDLDDFFSTVNPEVWLMPFAQGYGALTLAVQNKVGAYQQARITLQRYSETGQVLNTYYVDTYHTSLTTSDENAGIGDLPAGRYRITFLFSGRLYERWVQVESGKLTHAVIAVD